MSNKKFNQQKFNQFIIENNVIGFQQPLLLNQEENLIVMLIGEM